MYSSNFSFAWLIRDWHRLCLGEELFCTEHGQREVGYPPVRGGGIQRSISAVFQRIAYELRFLFIPGGLIGGIPLRTLKRTEKIQLQLLLRLPSGVISLTAFNVGFDGKPVVEFLYASRGGIFGKPGICDELYERSARVFGTECQETG